MRREAMRAGDLVHLLALPIAVAACVAPGGVRDAAPPPFVAADDAGDAMRARGPARPLEQLARLCLSSQGEELAGCTVAEFGHLATIDGREVYYALDDWGRDTLDEGPRAAAACPGAAMIFEGAVGAPTASPILLSARGDVPGEFCYTTPNLVVGCAGTFLELACSETGSGGIVCDDLFVRRGTAWQRIDTDRWLAEVGARLPDALEIRRGVGVDVATLTAESVLWAPGDAMCCPSGGTVFVTLEVRDHVLVVTSVSVTRP